MALVYLKNLEVTPEIGARAKAILSAHRFEKWGTVYYADFGGETLAFRLERHYHPPGGTAKPWGAHTGVSVLRLAPDPEPIAAERKTFVLGKLSLSRLVNVDPRLVAMVKRAIQTTEVDFAVIEGRRSKVRQSELVKAGASKTMNSRHLTGHAVDLAPWIGGKVSWQWPDFHRLAPFIRAAANEVKCPIEWGGNWAKFPDGPHWQIPWQT